MEVKSKFFTYGEDPGDRLVLQENYPDVSLFVQTNPSFCCPALITEAMTDKIRKLTGVPIVTITYDGTSDRMNDVIVPYIQTAVSRQQDPNVV